MTELEEEHGGEDSFLGALDKINKTEVSARLREIKNDPEAQDEIAILQEWIKLNEAESALKRQIKDAENALDKLASGLTLKSWQNEDVSSLERANWS